MNPRATHRRRPGALRRAAASAAALLACLALAGPAPAQRTASGAGATGSTLDVGDAAAAAAAMAAGPQAEANPPIAGRVDPATYRVGPGDELALRYSELSDPQILRIGPTGDLPLPNVGPFPAAGLTLADLEQRVRERMKPYVRGSGLTLTLLRPRRFRLFVLGDVIRPGPVTVQAPVRASEAIAAAGGIDPGGAERGIEVRRGTDTLRVDLARATHSGSTSSDPLVFETDVLYVPRAGHRLDALGAVGYPGRYDFVPGDRLSDLVAAAGGLMPEATADDATIERFDDDGRSTRTPAGLSAALAAPGSDADPLLREGDRLFVPSRGHWREGYTVSVEGEVARPGPYPIVPGQDRVLDALGRAGGLTAFADTEAVRIERVRAIAPPDTAFLRLARENEQLLGPSDRDYVVLRSKERKAVSADIGALLSHGDGRGNVLLADGDRIIVPRRFPFVSVQGEVKRPGYVPYVEGRTASEYVDEAGGYTSRANRGRVRVTLASTGRQVSVREASRLHAGDVVWIPSKEEKSLWDRLRDLLTTASQAATIYLVIHQATK